MKVEEYLQNAIEHPVPRPSPMMETFSVPIVILQYIMRDEKSLGKRIKDVLGIIVAYSAMVFMAYFIYYVVFQSDTVNPLLLLWSFIIGPYMIVVVFVALLKLTNLSDWWLRKKIITSYNGQPMNTVFSSEDYSQAAEILLNLKPNSYTTHIDTYPKRCVDILILAGAVANIQGKIKRIVSIKAIEKNQEAGWDE